MADLPALTDDAGAFVLTNDDGTLFLYAGSTSFTAVGFAVSAPVFASPATNFNLIVPNLISASPVIGKPSLVNTIAIGFASSPAVIGASALFGPAASLSPASPIITTPLIGYGFPKAANYSSPPPVFSNPASGFNLVAINFASPSPVVGSPTYIRTLFASSLSPAAPVFTNPYEAVSGKPGSLSPASPIFGLARLAILLTPANLTTASPVISILTLTYGLTAVSVSIPAPLITSPRLLPQLIAVPLATASPEFGLTLSSYNLSTPNVSPAPPLFTAAVYNQSQRFSAASLVPPAPGYTLPNALCVVAAAFSPSSPVLALPHLAGPLIAANLTVGSPVIGFVIRVLPANLVITSPLLSAPGKVNSLTAAGFVSPSPFLGAPQETVTLTAVSLLPIPPVFSAPFGAMNLFATSLSPFIALVFAQPNLLSPVAASLTVSSPNVNAPSLISSSITAAAMAVGSPVLGQPNAICMLAANLVTSSPQIYLTSLIWLYPTSFSTASPFVSNAGLFTQFQNMVATNLAASPVVITTPAFIAVNLSAPGFSDASPVFSGVDLAANRINAASLSVGSPGFGASPSEAPIYNFVAMGIVGKSPVFTIPNFAKNLPTANLTVGSPRFSGEQMRIATICFPRSFVVPPPTINNSVFSTVVGCLPSNILVSSPAVSPVMLFLPSPGQTIVYLGQDVLSQGLNELLNATTIYLCAGFSADWTYMAQNLVLGLKDYGVSGFAFGPIVSANPTGLQTSSYPILDGEIFADGQANYWAAVDAPNRKLLAVGVLSHPFMVITGQAFYLNSFIVQEGAQ